MPLLFQGRPMFMRNVAPIAALTGCFVATLCSALDLTGISVTPHSQSPNLRYRRPPDPQLGARVELFLRNDTDAMLPRIHAVEFLGEPQYGGGRPVPPQDVFSAFLPYGPTRLPTSVTHSEERVWRYSWAWPTASAFKRCRSAALANGQ